MKLKHIQIRIEQCLALSKASNCSRRKFGAILLDPGRNVILMDGYNGAARNGGKLCGDDWCHREGLKPEDLTIHGVFADGIENCYIKMFGKHVALPDGRQLYWRADAEKHCEALLAQYPPTKSGTRIEVGCHHAEMNVICNAAASGTVSLGAWLIVTGEPCLMCSKLIHHAGITKVIVVENGYMGSNGISYLKKHGIVVQIIEGPTDPRLKV